MGSYRVTSAFLDPCAVTPVTLKDPERLLVGNGKHVRHVKVRTPGDIDHDAFFDLIEAATR